MPKIKAEGHVYTANINGEFAFSTPPHRMDFLSRADYEAYIELFVPPEARDLIERHTKKWLKVHRQVGGSFHMMVSPHYIEPVPLRTFVMAETYTQVDVVIRAVFDEDWFGYRTLTWEDYERNLHMQAGMISADMSDYLGNE